MAQITLPNTDAYKPAEFDLIPSTSFVQSRGAYSGRLRSTELVGGFYWKARLLYPANAPGHAVTHAAIEALVHRLRSRNDTLLLWDLRRPVPQGTIGGSPVVNGAAAQYATTIGIRNASLATATLKAGDWLGIGGHLYMVTQDFTASANTFSSVTIDPPLRAAVSDGAAITLTRPTQEFVLVSDSLVLGGRGAELKPIVLELESL